MNNNDNLMFGVLAGAAVVIPVALGLGLGWSAWLYVSIVLILLGTIAVVRQRVVAGKDQAMLPAPVPAPRPAMETMVQDARVDSSMDGYGFRFAGRVRWRPMAHHQPVPHADPQELARAAILERTLAITRTMAPTDEVVARHRLAAALGVEEPDARRLVLVAASDVTLTVPDEDADALRTMAGHCRQTQVWELERDHERSVRKYLGTEVLETTGTALVWWLGRHLDDVEQAVRLIDALGRLSAVAQGHEVPGSSHPHVLSAATDGQHSWAIGADGGATASASVVVDGRNGAEADELHRLFDVLFPDREDPLRMRFAHELATLVSEFDGDSVAERIREQFGPREVRPDGPDQDMAPPEG